MSVISARALVQTFRIRPDKATELSTRLRLATTDREVEDALQYASKVLDGHGVEVVQSADHRAWDSYWRDVLIAYVNMGDPYRGTILYDVRKSRFTIGSWGDWVETYEIGGGSVAGLSELRRRKRGRGHAQARR